jgi:hypothetical protein
MFTGIFNLNSSKFITQINILSITAPNTDSVNNVILIPASSSSTSASSYQFIFNPTYNYLNQIVINVSWNQSYSAGTIQFYGGIYNGAFINFFNLININPQSYSFTCYGIATITTGNLTINGNNVTSITLDGKTYI